MLDPWFCGKQYRGHSKTAVLLMLALALVTACNGGSAPTVPANGPGNPAVYSRIAGETDCATVQGEFDTAAKAHDGATSGSDTALAATGYMVAAQARIKALNCP